MPERAKIKLKLKEKRRIIKNICVLSLAFMLHFTSYQGMSNLQSSINAKDRLGTIALSLIFLTITVSCTFLPTFVIRQLTAKWSIVISMFCYVPFFLAQLYPRNFTILPACIVLGLGAGPMWSALSTYITQLAQIYAIMNGHEIINIIVLFFGIFFLAWQTAEVWGNLISSLIIKGQSAKNTPNDLSFCGANYCFQDGETFDRPPMTEISLLVIVYLTCILTAVLLIFNLDSLKRYGEKRLGSESAQTGYFLLLASFKQMMKRRQIALTPITIWIGLEQSFIGGDFTRNYIACALEVHDIGYIMICFGATNAVCSIFFGVIIKYVGRAPIIILGATVHLGTVIFTLFWQPSKDHYILFILVASFWGLGDAVWQTQINGFYGLLFRRNKEAAFATYRLWESAGFALGFSLDSFFCARIKIYILLATLTTGILGYALSEFLHFKKVQGQKLHTHSATSVNVKVTSFTTLISHLLQLSIDSSIGGTGQGDRDELEDDIVVDNDDDDIDTTAPSNSKK